MSVRTLTPARTCASLPAVLAMLLWGARALAVQSPERAGMKAPLPDWDARGGESLSRESPPSAAQLAGLARLR